MTAFAEQLKRTYPDNLGKLWTLKVSALDTIATGALRPVLLILLGAVRVRAALIACANVANLLLARGAGRIKEIAIRAALGADRSALVRQLLTESLLLSVTGGAIGLALAYWGVKSFVAIVPTLGSPGAIRIDGVVHAFTFALAIVTGLVFGLVPALQSSRPDLQDTLKEGGRTGWRGRLGACAASRARRPGRSRSRSPCSRVRDC